MMKRLLLAILMINSVMAFPMVMNQHGVLRDNANNPLTGLYLFNVTFYRVIDNLQMYSEEKLVGVNNGIWNYYIGQNVSINPSIFEDDLYINLTVGIEHLGRVNLSSNPYAFYSYQSNNSFYLGGQLPGFYLDDTDTFNTTAEMRAAVNGSILDLSNAFGYIETDSAHDDCSEIAGCVVGAIIDGNTGWTNTYGLVTNATMNQSTHCSNIDGATSNLCTLVDADTWNTTSQMRRAVNNTKLNLGTAYGYTETDSAHDQCSEIADCVVGAITDGNTGWTNTYGLVTNATMNQSTHCSNIDGATSNLCTIVGGSGFTYSDYFNQTLNTSSEVNFKSVNISGLLIYFNGTDFMIG